MEHNLTNGKIGGSLIAFSLPLILGNLLSQLYNVADTLIVGRALGAAALSAVGSAYSLMVLLTSVVLGLCMGSGVVFAQLYGARKNDELKISIANALAFILLLTFIITALSYILLDNFIMWINVPPNAANMAREYLNIIFSGMIFVSVYNFIACALRSIGNTVVPLIILGTAAITNIVLDILFVVYFNWGVAGAAIATVIAQALSAGFIVIYFFVKAKSLCPSRRHCKYNKQLLQKIISNSALTAIQQSIMNFGILMVQGLVNSFGFAASAAFAVVVKIDAFAYMPAQDFGNGFSTFAAQNYGARKPERIKKGFSFALLISSVFCMASSALVFIFAKQLMLLFLKPGETQAIEIGIGYLRTAGAFYIGIGVLFLLYGLFRGLGRASVSVVLTVISLGSRVALAYMLSSISAVGLLGIWWAVPIGWALADIYGLVLYFKNRNNLIKETG